MIHSLLSLLFASTLQGGPSASFTTPKAFDESSLISVMPLPVKDPAFVQPGAMSATTAFAVDVDSQAVLFKKDADVRVHIASITKLMTAALVLDENNPDDIVTVSQNAASTPGSRMGLSAGEQISIAQLLHGLLIESGNDAAVALAEYNAGSTAQFVEKMNSKAKELGLNNTRYVNPTGLDSESAYSSARDVALLASHLVEDPNIQAIVKLKEVELTSQSGQVHKLKSTNVLLGELGIKGLKTGTTTLAGECLVSFAKSPSGHDIVTVVLGSKNRFSDTRTLVEWIYNAYHW